MISLLCAFDYAILAWILGGVVLFALVSWIVMYAIIARWVYLANMRRKGKESWSRGKPSCDEPEQIAMYNEGMAWHAANVDKKHDVHVVRDGCNLYGEYYDFGNERCVIIMSGRTESLEYGYYFASPYQKSGCNVLVVDPRAHGLSDGEFNTAGFEESKDVLVWARFLHDNFGVKSIVLHCICIGAAGGMFAITSDDCPDYIDGMVAEGMFANFSESMKEHLIEKKKPVFLLNDMIDVWMKHYVGHSGKFGPINVIDKMRKPLLMIHSKEDAYSTPEYAEKLFDKAQSEPKKLVWFEHGRHSMLRIADTPKYDKAIVDFVTENFSK